VSAGSAVSPRAGYAPFPYPPGRAGLVAAALCVAAFAGAAATVRPSLAFGGLCALALCAGILAHPPIAAYALILLTPLTVGIDRDTLLPVLRPSEALLFLVGAALAARWVAGFAAGHPLTLRLPRIDAVLVALAFCGSVLPIMWMIARGAAVERDDVLYGLQLWKYYGVFVIVRAAVRTIPDVRRCLWVAMGASAIVALVGIAQIAGVGPVNALIAAYFAPFQDTGAVENLRATSTIASSQAVGDVQIFSLAISAGFLLRGHQPRGPLIALTGLFVAGALAAGQFSGFIGLAVGAFAIGMITGRLGRLALAGGPAVLALGIALAPVIERRLTGFQTAEGLPPSWLGRVANLRSYFIPELSNHYQWVLGVRPAARVPAVEPWRQFVFLESGHVWLLWTGGVVLFAAYVVYTVYGTRLVARVARARDDAVGIAAVASFTAFVVVTVEMIFDPHLTLRGSAELAFALLALALCPAAPQRVPPPAGDPPEAGLRFQRRVVPRA
jgi:hypothetical protein